MRYFTPARLPLSAYEHELTTGEGHALDLTVHGITQTTRYRVLPCGTGLPALPAMHVFARDGKFVLAKYEDEVREEYGEWRYLGDLAAVVASLVVLNSQHMGSR